jgi:hypothetical protein
MRSKDVIIALGLLLLYFGCSVLISGYSWFSATNEFTYLIVKKIANPELYPNDFFADKLFEFPSPFWWVIGWLHQLAPLRALALIGFTVNRLLTLAAFGFLGYCLATNGRKTAAVLSVILAALGPNCYLGSSPITTGNALYHTAFAYPFLIAAFGSFHARYYYQALILLVIGFFINSLYGLFAFSYIGMWALERLRNRGERIPLLICAATFSAIAGGYIIYASSLNSGASTAAKEIAAKLALITTPYHTDPFYPSSIEYIFTGAYTALAFGLVGYWWKPYRERALFILLSTAVASIYLGAWFLVTLYLPKASLVVLQFGRGNDLWFIYISIYAIITIIDFYCTNSTNAKRISSQALLIAVFTAHLYDIKPELIFYFIFLILLIISITLLNRLKHQVIVFSSLLLITSGIAAAWNRYSANYGEGHKTLITWTHPDLSADYSLEYDLAKWARTSTKVDDKFIAPSNFRFFRTLSERPTHMIYDDSLVLYFNFEAAKTWWKWHNEFGITFNEELSKLRDKNWMSIQVEYQTDERKLEIAKKYNIKYWIVRNGVPTRFPIAIQNDKFKVLDIQAGW